jgi:hypothetical protein
MNVLFALTRLPNAEVGKVAEPCIMIRKHATVEPKACEDVFAQEVRASEKRK